MFLDKIRNYIVALFFIGIVAWFSYWVNKQFGEQKQKDDYELVKEYLLNDSPLQGHNKPKIWVHSTNEVNSRDWKKNMFRNTVTDIAQPYIVLTVQSIINHCSDDFHICLIDDRSFGKLIPTWDVDLTTIADPMKSYIREIGMLQLLYFYGGIRVPNTFLCTRSLAPLYNDYKTTMFDSSKYADGTEPIPFVTERENRNRQANGPFPFSPNMELMGSVKNSEIVKEWANHLKDKIKDGHVSGNLIFTGEMDRVCTDCIDKKRALLVDGHFFGIKDNDGHAITATRLLGEQYLNLKDQTLYGILIPGDDMLHRVKHRWFSQASQDEILNNNKCVLSKYFKMSMVNLTETN